MDWTRKRLNIKVSHQTLFRKETTKQMKYIRQSVEDSSMLSVESDNKEASSDESTNTKSFDNNSTTDNESINNKSINNESTDSEDNDYEAVCGSWSSDREIYVVLYIFLLL